MVGERSNKEPLGELENGEREQRSRTDWRTLKNSMVLISRSLNSW